MRITHKALYRKLRDDSLISQWQQYAEYTLPHLMADPLQIASSGKAIIERDFQEVGALLTNNLAAKLARLLFPTQYSFFKCEAGPAFKKHAISKGIDQLTLNGMFAKVESEANSRLFVNGGYAQLILFLRYLIVTGNALLYRNSTKGKLIAYGPSRYAVKRDTEGEMIDCVLQEYTTVEALPWDVQQVLRAKEPLKYGRPECQVEKYTRIHRKWVKGTAMYEVSEEVDTVPVGNTGQYPQALCPWIAATWNLIPGEDYGRGLVEDYAQAFAKLSSQSEAAALYGIEMMRVLHLVGSGSGGDADALATASSGEWHQGDPNQVGAYEAGDAQKLQQVEASIAVVVQRLSRAFMYQGNTRDAERVTRYELEQEAQEVEYVMGGNYSSISSTVHIPLANVLMTEVSDEALAGILTGEIRPDITSGIQALGRSADVQNLTLAAQEIGVIAPLSQVDDRISISRVTDVVFAARGIDPTTVFRTEAELKAHREAVAAQQNATLQLQQADLAQRGAQAIEQGI